MPGGAQVLGHLIVLRMPGPDGALLWRDAVLIGRHLRHVVPKLIHTVLVQIAATVVGVVEPVLGRTRGGGVGGTTQTGTSTRGERMGQAGAGKGAGRQGAGQGRGGTKSSTGVGLLRPAGLVEGWVSIMLLDGECSLQGHGVEGVQLLGVQLFPKAGSPVGEPDLDAGFGQLGLLRQFFSGVDVRVLGPAEGAFQGFQLFAGEGRSGSALFSL